MAHLDCVGQWQCNNGGQATRKGSGKRRKRSKSARTQVRTFFPLFSLLRPPRVPSDPSYFALVPLDYLLSIFDIGPRESHLRVEWFSPIYVYYRVGSDGVLLLLSLEFDRCLLPQVWSSRIPCRHSNSFLRPPYHTHIIPISYAMFYNSVSIPCFVRTNLEGYLLLQIRVWQFKNSSLTSWNSSTRTGPSLVHDAPYHVMTQGWQTLVANSIKRR